MANYELFDKQINDTLHLQFMRNDQEKETITWQTWLTNTRTKEKWMLDNYTLSRIPMQLGDSSRIDAGEDMIFHHNLANAVFIDRSLYLIRNKQGLIYLEKYTFTKGAHFTKLNFYLTNYFAVGALAYGYQYADFLQHGNDLFILINAGCQMSVERPDRLFEFNRERDRLTSLTFNSITKNEERSVQKLETKENPFVSLDVKSKENARTIENKILQILTRNRRNAAATYWGAVENMNSNNNFHFGNHLRSSGVIYFFYGRERSSGEQILRFSMEGPVNYWYVEDVTKTPLSGKEES